MTLSQYTIPNNVLMTLESQGLYYVTFTFQDNFNGVTPTMTFYPRSPLNRPWTANVGNGDTYVIDGKIWSGILVDYGTSNTIGMINEGVNELPFRFLFHFLGNNPNNQYIKPVLTDTPSRSLERISPRNGQAYAGLVPTSIASAGANLTGALLTFSPGDLLFFQLAISQDAAGTAPHASYVQILDPNGNAVVSLYGEMGGNLTGSIQVGLAGAYTYVAHNGDSVAHFFQVLVTQVIS